MPTEKAMELADLTLSQVSQVYVIRLLRETQPKNVAAAGIPASLQAHEASGVKEVGNSLA